MNLKTKKKSDGLFYLEKKVKGKWVGCGGPYKTEKNANRIIGDRMAIEERKRFRVFAELVMAKPWVGLRPNA